MRVGRFHAQAVVSLVVAIAAGAPAVAGGEPSLYAVTVDGRLCSIDRTTGHATQVRAQLAPPYRSCDSLEFASGWFFASYQGGLVVRFGLHCGDEVSLGTSGAAAIEAIARRSDGVLFAAVSQNGDVSAEAVGVFDPSTGDVSSLVTSGNLGLVDDIDAMAFASDGTLWVANLQAPSLLATFDLGSGAIGSSHPIGAILGGLAWSSEGTLYGVDVVDGGCTSIAKLVVLDPSTGGVVTVGSTGFTCLTGLTFGPTAGAAADLDGDGIVAGSDLAILLGAWGRCGAGCCIADLDLNGSVDAADLALLLGAWST